MAGKISPRQWWMLVIVACMLVAVVSGYFTHVVPTNKDTFSIQAKPHPAPATLRQPDPLAQYDRCEGPADMRGLPEVTPLPPRPRRAAAEILCSHPELARWFEQWKGNVSRNPHWHPTPDHLSNLDHMIRSAGLSAFDQFDVCADMLAITGETPEVMGTSVWARAAVDAAFIELQQEPDPDTERYLVRAMGEGTAALWYSWDGKTLERMTEFLAKYPRERRWDQMPEWSVIGHAESLYLQADHAKALAELDEIERQIAADPHRFTPRQRDEVKWCRALIALNQQRYAEAVALVRPVAYSPGFQHVQQAHRFLVESLAMLGDKENAEKELYEYCRRYKPTAEQTQSMVKQLAIEIIRARQLSGHS